jgi:hypothetical protein
MRSRSPFMDIIEGDHSRRIHALSSDLCSFEAARQIREGWRRDDKYCVFNAGTYDIVTVNHILNLIQCRALGAIKLCELLSIETDQDLACVHAIAASDAIALMITLDTDIALKEKKSRQSDKGGAPKPTLSWDNRARMLAMQTIPKPDYGSGRPAVDFITRHGLGCCAVCPSGLCVNEDNAGMVVGLQPDMVLVNADSTDTVESLKYYKISGALPNTDIVVNNEADHQYWDSILDGPVKTTKIITRIRS